MKIEIKNEVEIWLSHLHEAGIEIAREDPELYFGSMQMFVTAIALCTFSVLASYGERFGTPAEGITVGMKWDYAQRPFRISKIDMDIRWPNLPQSRLDAATRAAQQCTLHNTLHHDVDVETLVQQ
jgi:uncharacterized OsmC-like protein